MCSRLSQARPVRGRRAGDHQAHRRPSLAPSGTRLVLFDVKVERDQVRVFTHTAEPVVRPGGGPAAYGCTEFVLTVQAR